MKNRLLSILLVVLTLFGALIIPVTAAEPEDPAPAVEKDYKVKGIEKDGSGGKMKGQTPVVPG